ncbi:uncharacterized protein LOC119112944 [Pollicipes pollicipes]|uniref:uncharacterized protein LOC119112944 n=1 Tax=Pollicipes pollicipes TaxID=41117 RepID=UPI0018856189|nr:uncharacterized protein LOC119112944 [Pollicipes pollicipes]
MEFMVCGKQVIIVRGEEDVARAVRIRRWRGHRTHTRISCPPRSLVGPGAARLLASSQSRCLMELETTSSGGRLEALSGASVWRTVDDFCRLVRYISRTAFENGRPVVMVLPELEFADSSRLKPLLMVTPSDGDQDALRISLLDEIRTYVSSLTGAAERNELPVCVLRSVLSFLGGPPAGKRSSRGPALCSPMRVWLTMARISEQRFDVGLVGRARKRHHTHVGQTTAGWHVKRRPRRRHRTAPADPSRCLVHRLELSTLPEAHEHPLDRFMAARTVRYCCRKPSYKSGADWVGSMWTSCWRDEVVYETRMRQRRLLRGLTPRPPQGPVEPEPESGPETEKKTPCVLVQQAAAVGKTVASWMRLQAAVARYVARGSKQEQRRTSAPARLSFWHRLFALLAPSAPEGELQPLEVAQEATDARVKAILLYQKYNLPIMFRMMRSDSG